MREKRWGLFLTLLLLVQGHIAPWHASAAPVTTQEVVVINYKTGSAVMSASEMKKLFSLASRIEASSGKNVTIARSAYYKKGSTATKLQKLAVARLLNIQETSLEIPLTARFLRTSPIPYTVNSYAKSSQVTLLVTWELPQPSITLVSPNVGQSNGGTAVKVSGTNFIDVKKVSIGGADLKTFTVDSPTSISFVTPSSTAGIKDLVITTKGGEATLKNAFTYLNASITSVTPQAGTAGGGTTVQIKGVGLASTTAVNFGTKPAQSFTVNSDSQITAISPSGSAGNIVITVITASGSPTINFNYTPNLPTLTSLSSQSGNTSGGNSVVINGTNLTGTTAVTFGGTPVTSFVVNSDTQITVVTPAKPAGPVLVVVTTAAGQSTSNITYTYENSVSISPASGPISGGITVTITGTNLTGTSSVTFNGNPATSFTVVNSSTVTAVTPALPAGVSAVRITTPTDVYTATFSYLASPIIQSISPSSGPLSGGTNVVITGYNFSGVSLVKFGNTNTSFVVNSNNSITAVSPSVLSPTTVQILVQSSISPAATTQFTYVAVPVPAITTISPNTGPVSGGNTVIVTGTNLLNTSSVSFGGTPATAFTVNSATQLTVVAPAKSAGLAVLTVTTPGGTAGGAYTFVGSAAPTATSLSPISGSTSGGTVVTITGTNLTGATSVTFGGTSALSVSVINSTTIQAITPSKTAGAVVVVVTTPGGSATAAIPYTFIAGVPTITSVSPGLGSTAGGNSVVITGTNFVGTTSVKFGANSASITNTTSTSLTVTVPAGVSGAVAVEVVTAGGTASLGSAYTYLAPPTITSFTPGSGPTEGGTTVTITGTGFTGTTLVTFGSTAATIVSVSPTSIVVTTPARAAGSVTITVVNAVGSATSVSTFTFSAT